MPKIQRTLRLASSVTPPEILIPLNVGRAKRIAAPANKLRAKPFAAKSDPEYLGYVNGR